MRKFASEINLFKRGFTNNSWFANPLQILPHHHVMLFVARKEFFQIHEKTCPLVFGLDQKQGVFERIKVWPVLSNFLFGQFCRY